MSEKWTKIQFEYDGRESDVNDFTIHYHKNIDGKMYYVKEQGGKIISKTLSKNIVR